MNNFYTSRGKFSPNNDKSFLPNPHPGPKPGPHPGPRPDPQPGPHPGPKPGPQPGPHPGPKPDPHPGPHPYPPYPAPYPPYYPQRPIFTPVPIIIPNTSYPQTTYVPVPQPTYIPVPQPTPPPYPIDGATNVTSTPNYDSLFGQRITTYITNIGHVEATVGPFSSNTNTLLLINIIKTDSGQNLGNMQFTIDQLTGIGY